MTHRGWIVLLLACTLSACSTSHVVRLEQGRGAPLTITPGVQEAAARPTPAEFKRSLKQLTRDVRPFADPLREAREHFQLPPRSGWYGLSERTHQLIPLGSDDERDLHLLDGAAPLTRSYQAWCKRKGQSQDCLRLLQQGPLLGSDGRYALALAIAMDSVWDETATALEGMASPEALLATMTSAVTLYLLLWAMPEPVSKGVAAILTVAAMGYLCVDTVWTLLNGWLTLVRAADEATTFEGLRDAGEAYGAVLGKDAARIFVMLVTAALGNTAGLMTRASGLPGSAEAALSLETQAGFSFSVLSDVESVAMTAEGFTIALAPNALAMSSRDMKVGQKHHLATVRNEKSAARGGPWTPLVRRLFKKAGMELTDPENVVEVPGHRGPHPQEYHERIYRRLFEATRTCRTVTACRELLTRELAKLSQEAATSGTRLNALLTGSP